MEVSEVAEIFIDVHRFGIELYAEGENLRYRGPREAVNEELLTRLKEHKTEILSLLQKPEPLHYALGSVAVLGVPVEEPCLVGCGFPVRFYWQNGSGYGYCSQCDVHQRIETKII